MKNIVKLENQFLFLIILLVIFYSFFKDSFWNFFIVPIGNENLDFTDLRCVQSWKGLINYYTDLEELYSSYNKICRLNYPKIWVLISKFFFQEKFTYYYLSINFILYSYVYFILIKKQKSYFFLYFYLSGASLLLLERGNIESLIFILIYFIFSNNRFINLIIFQIAVFLKVFPVFAVFGFIDKNKNLFIFIFASIISFFYFLYSYQELTYLFSATPKTGDMSYGSLAITSNLKKHFDIDLNHLYLSLTLIITSIFLYMIKLKKIMGDFNYSNINMFLSGAGIFIFTFILSSNHDYRLIFLLFTVPLILDLKNKTFIYLLIPTIIFSLELHKLIYFLGFFGGVINSFFKIVLFYLIFLLFLDIVVKKSKDYFKILTS